MRVPARHSMDPWWAVAFGVGRALVFGAPPPACLCRSVVPFVPIFMRDSVCGGYSGVMREPARHLGSSLWAVYLEASEALLSNVSPLEPSGRFIVPLFAIFRSGGVRYGNGGVVRVPARHSVGPWWGVAFGVGRALVFGAPPPVYWGRSVVPRFAIFRCAAICCHCGDVMREPARHLGSSLWTVSLEAGKALLPNVPLLSLPGRSAVPLFAIFRST